MNSKVRKPVPVATAHDGTDMRDPLQTVRDFRLRKVATKRIPSRIG